MPRTQSPMLTQLLRDNPIVVTGVGSYSVAGDSVEALWRAAMAARGLAEWREFLVANESRRFAVCSAPPLEVHTPELRFARKADRCTRMALHAANVAWQQAAIDRAYAPERMGIIVGSSRGPIGKIEES